MKTVPILLDPFHVEDSSRLLIPTGCPSGVVAGKTEIVPVERDAGALMPSVVPKSKARVSAPGAR